ncbi:MAG: hypothetical protein OXC62_06440 [Aestuariivita sp.]|nr:hypothetical protein [Aestuariivita sp.]
MNRRPDSTAENRGLFAVWETDCSAWTRSWRAEIDSDGKGVLPGTRRCFITSFEQED